jgi:predicted Zn-dependent protease
MHDRTANSAVRPGQRLVRQRAGISVLLLSMTAGACAISTQQEQQLGANYSAQLEKELEFVNDAAVNNYVTALGNRLASQGERGLSYRFRVVNSNVLNAFAVPGGYVYINRGIIERASNMSELAGVMAHEISHVEERHTAEQLGRVQSANVGLSLAYILMGRQPSGVENAAINVGGGLVLARYSRGAEEEADAVAVPMMVGAGINPRGLSTFFQKLLADERRSPSTVEMWFSTHPTTSDRVGNVDRRIARVPQTQLRGLASDDQRFQGIKSRLAQIARARS